MDLILKIFNFIFSKVYKNGLEPFVHRTLDRAEWKCETQSARHNKHVNSNREKTSCVPATSRVLLGAVAIRMRKGIIPHRLIVVR